MYDVQAIIALTYNTNVEFLQKVFRGYVQC